MNERPYIGLKAVVTILTVTLFVTSTYAATEKVLYSFGGTPDGAGPNGNLIFDAAGDLFGTTEAGGMYGGGTVFELIPKAGGGWSRKVLHNFGEDMDAEIPSAGLIFDAAGNLYGTTYEGGAYDAGTVFELKAIAGGRWVEKVLHSFDDSEGLGDASGGHGFHMFGPYAGVIFDRSGNLYGTAYYGGVGNGAVFELTPKAGGIWTEKSLHYFRYNRHNGDGGHPYAGLIFDGSGNLYGTTYVGGDYNSGTVFELMPNAGGGWTEQVLHSFNNNGKDGAEPYASLIFDASGNLYGTTSLGGDYGGGAVFELKGGGAWTILHSFNNEARDGTEPSAGVIFDAVGNLYGTTSAGGAQGGGTVFELMPKASGGWTEKILHNFGDDGKDGIQPRAGLIFDSAGNLYGTTSAGGARDQGTVFEITP